MKRNVYCVLLAAGRGARFGADENKCFVPLDGASVLRRAYEAFAVLPEITDIVVCVAPGEEARARQALGKPLTIKPTLIPGGVTRQASVLAALSYLMHTVPDKTAAVLIHDAARCLVTPSLISACLTALQTDRVGVAPAIPVKDTIRQVDATGHVVRRHERAVLSAMQTPQGARLDILNEAYRMAAEAGLALTDDLAALEFIGYPVRLVPGEERNLKITTPFDLKLAEMWLKVT